MKWALIQYDQHLYEKRQSGHMHTQRKDHARSREEDGHLTAKDSGLKKTDPTDTLILDFQLPKLWANKLLMFKSPSLCKFVMDALAN